MTRALYALYTARLRRQVRTGAIPRHVGLIMDGNRRWARRMGYESAAPGHRAGADHVDDLLGWCTAIGVEHVTVFVCSTENLDRRDADEVDYLMGLLETVISDRLTRHPASWRVRVSGLVDALPDTTRHALKRLEEQTDDPAAVRHLTLAVGYGGRQEIVDAVRQVLWQGAEAGSSPAEIADSLRIEDISANLYVADQPEPDLIIRTSGEQRMSNFLLWQGAYSELYFCDAYWPAFREIDFLRAVRSFGTRNRRFGA